MAFLVQSLAENITIQELKVAGTPVSSRPAEYTILVWCLATVFIASIKSTRICTFENLCALNINIKCANGRSLLINRSQSPWQNAVFCHRSAAHFWVSVLILRDGIYLPVLSHKVEALLIGQPLLPSTIGEPLFPFRLCFSSSNHVNEFPLHRAPCLWCPLLKQNSKIF